MSVEVLELQNVAVTAGLSTQSRNLDIYLHSDARIKPSKIRNDYYGNGFLINQGFTRSWSSFSPYASVTGSSRRSRRTAWDYSSRPS